MLKPEKIFYHDDKFHSETTSQHQIIFSYPYNDKINSGEQHYTKYVIILSNNDKLLYGRTPNKTHWFNSFWFVTPS